LITLPVIQYEFPTGLGLLVASNTTGTSVSADLPAGYYGYVVIEAHAWYNDVPIGGADFAQVRLANLLLAVDNAAYRPGDTVTFDWQIVTSVDAGTLIYEIADEAESRWQLERCLCDLRILRVRSAGDWRSRPAPRQDVDDNGGRRVRSGQCKRVARSDHTS